MECLMAQLSLLESEACDQLVKLALDEDIAEAGDVTSKAILPEPLQGQAQFVVRENGTIAGLCAAERVFDSVDKADFIPFVKDGARVTRGKSIALAKGPMRDILTAERSALNFLQHLSGIATLTRRFVD